MSQEKFRSIALKLRKVRGYLHPADLLTKHVPSQEELNLLVTLFGLAVLGGRVRSAPLLRKRRLDELAGKVFADQDIVEAERIDEDGSVLMLEAGKHDIERWPLLYPGDEIEVMFPIVTATPDIDHVSIEALGEHRALEERWATRRPVGPTRSRSGKLRIT